MARFQLVFRGGVVLVDGASFVGREAIWLATRDDLLDNYGESDMVRSSVRQFPT